MNQTSTARYMMFTILAMGIVFSVSGLVAGQIIQTAYATDPKHRDNNDNNPTAVGGPKVVRSNIDSVTGFQ